MRTLVLAAALLGHAASGRAEPAVQTARRLYLEGEELRRQGHPDGALSRYQRAYTLVPTPVLLLRQAEAYRALGRPQEAARAVSDIDPARLPEPERRALSTLRSELILAQPAPRPAPRHTSAGKWLLGGISVMALVVGGGLVLAGRPSCEAGGCGPGQALRAVGLGLLSGGVAGLGGAATWFLLEPGARPDAYPR